MISISIRHWQGTRFMKITRSGIYADYLLFDTGKNGFEQRAMNEFERMVRMEQIPK